MKKIKQLKGWRIYENNQKEAKEYGFRYTIIHPNLVDCGLLSPADSDMQFDTLDDCFSWILSY